MPSFDWKNIYRASAAGLAVALAQISITPVQAADYDVGSIHIAEPWTRATPKGASSGAGYVTIANKGAVPDRVTCMSSDVSAACQPEAVGLAFNAHGPQTPPGAGQDGRGDAAFREGRNDQNRVSRCGYRRSAPGTHEGDGHPGVMHMDKH